MDRVLREQLATVTGGLAPDHAGYRDRLFRVGRWNFFFLFTVVFRAKRGTAARVILSFY